MDSCTEIRDFCNPFTTAAQGQKNVMRLAWEEKERNSESVIDRERKKQSKREREGQRERGTERERDRERGTER